MTILSTLGDALSVISCIMLSGYIGVFIVPDIIMGLFYLLPKSISLCAQKKIRVKGVFAVLGMALFWILLIAAIYIAAFFLDENIAWDLLTSPEAIFCWICSVISIIYTIAKRKDHYLDTFFTGTYMKYATENELQTYQGFIEHVERLSIAEAKSELETPSLSYLEKKALNERISLLQNP